MPLIHVEVSLENQGKRPLLRERRLELPAGHEPQSIQTAAWAITQIEREFPANTVRWIRINGDTMTPRSLVMTVAEWQESAYMIASRMDEVRAVNLPKRMVERAA